MKWNHAGTFQGSQEGFQTQTPLVTLGHSHTLHHCNSMSECIKDFSSFLAVCFFLLWIFECSAGLSHPFFILDDRQLLQPYDNFVLLHSGLQWVSEKHGPWSCEYKSDLLEVVWVLQNVTFWLSCTCLSVLRLISVPIKFTIFYVHTDKHGCLHPCMNYTSVLCVSHLQISAQYSLLPCLHQLMSHDWVSMNPCQSGSTVQFKHI